MAKEYIERKALLSEYDRQHTGEPGRARKLIEDAPAANVVEVVHGRWLSEMHGNYNNGTCSACGSYEHAYAFGWNYCPDCGARMDGE